ncbi:DUF4160 domain-containing protein [Asticcacaulis sp. YBE204]|uniref:DUF4160 domain-containing protein n=1 Tax=Asticcacaulis sp. YBE204 TaxID=1282363 RepID=UPI0004CFE4E1|nr:DUF4160 domain-containing protein [Asticcacaulis sp. YBE204]
MPTVLQIGNIRVIIYTNDHPPPHVHAVKGNEARARFALNGPDGPVELMEQEGFKPTEVRKIGEAIAENLTAICEKWSEIHG